MKHLAWLMVLFAAWSGCIPSRMSACTSFAVFSRETWYGMNFDYTPTDIQLSITHSSGCTIFLVGFSGGGHIAEMNDRGLFIDLQQLNYLTPQNFTIPDQSLEIRTLYSEPIKSMSTVAEVTDYIGGRQVLNSWGVYSHALIADMTGAAMVVEPFANYTGITPISGQFLVMTNFPNYNFINQDYRSVYGVGADRYQTAYAYIRDHLEGFGYQDAFQVLQRTAQYSGYPTRVSMVFNPTTREVFVCFSTDFTRVLKVSLATETIETYAGFDVSEVRRLDATGVFASTLQIPTLAAATMPVLILQPQNQTAVAGSPVVLSALATGIGITYQWSKDGTIVAGATDRTLTLTNLTTAQAGNYSVVATNPVGSIASQSARLTVLTPPVVATPPVSQHVAPGGSVTFSVTATGDAPLTYQWKLNGTAIAGATNATFTVANVQAGNMG
ncbi:MAG TPA: immunoglobulin domain-containing protein, partial [Opitutaceae bacterium]|nr:immunoglobulin domain-containing protein [Opitutaceae bacterium]